MNYRTLARGPFLRGWAALLLSRVGSNAGFVALLWLANARGGGAGAVGILTAALTLPAVVSGVYAGALLDRMPRGLAIALDNLGRGVIYAAIAALAAEPSFRLAAIAPLVALGSALSPLSEAGILSLLPDLITEGQTLGTANAAINAVWQIATLIGPAIGGALAARFGAVLPLGLQAALYLVAFALMLGLRHIHGAPSAQPSVFAGVLLLMRSPSLRSLALFTLAYSLAYAPLEVVLPGFVSRGLHLGAAAYGVLWAIFAGGALVGTLVSGALRSLPRLGLWLAGNFILWGTAVLVLAQARDLALAGAAMAAGGLIYAPYPLWTNTYLQRSVAKDVLGRLMGAYMAVTGVGLPLGALLASAAAPLTGARSLLDISGAACVGLALLATAVRPMRGLPTLDLSGAP